MSAKIPLCLITGFLGCGKTTFLKHLIQENRDRRYLYLINDFSVLDVDAQLLAEGGDGIISVPGGSIFCKCLVTEFVGQLKKISELDADNPIEGVIIEASGMANPRVIGTMLKETRLDAEYELCTVLSVVEPNSLRKLLCTLPNIRAQIEASDAILLNKTDLYEEPELAECEASIRAINDSAPIRRTQFGDVEIDLWGGVSAALELDGEYAKCRDPLYDTFTTEHAERLDLDQLKEELLAREEDLLRVKGYLRSENGAVYLCYSKAGLRVSDVPEYTGNYGLAWIVPGDKSESIRAWAETYSAS